MGESHHAAWHVRALAMVPCASSVGVSVGAPVDEPELLESYGGGPPVVVPRGCGCATLTCASL